jgi:hypothetical protein
MRRNKRKSGNTGGRTVILVYDPLKYSFPPHLATYALQCLLGQISQAHGSRYPVGIGKAKLLEVGDELIEKGFGLRESEKSQGSGCKPSHGGVGGTQEGQEDLSNSPIENQLRLSFG